MSNISIKIVHSSKFLIGQAIQATVKMQNPSSFQSEYEPFFTKTFWPHGGQEPQFNNGSLQAFLTLPANQFPTQMEMNAVAGQKTRVSATDCGKIVCNVELTVVHNKDVSVSEIPVPFLVPFQPFQEVIVLEYVNGEQGLFDFQTFLACQRVISMKRSQDQLTELLKAPRKVKLSKAEKRAFGAVEVAEEEVSFSPKKGRLSTNKF